MSDFLSAYSIQNWLESCPQGYLDGTVYGHAPEDEEPEILFENPVLHESSIRTTVQLVAGERCALAASSGLINCAPDFPSKRFLATQTLDEARHVEIFTQRLYDLGVKKDELEDTIARHASPHLVKFAEAGENVGRAEYNGTDLNGMEAGDIEGVLANTVIGEFKTRLSRIGLEYQSPV